MALKRDLRTLHSLRIVLPTRNQGLSPVVSPCDPEFHNEENIAMPNISTDATISSSTEITMETSDTDKTYGVKSKPAQESKLPPKRELRQRRSEGRLAAIVSDIALSQSLVQLLADPTVFNFSRLRNKLKSDDRRWMSGFLKLGGLEMLFEGLRSFGSYSGTFSNLVQRLECVMCIKTVMNSQIGMNTITTSDHFGEKFAAGVYIP